MQKSSSHDFCPARSASKFADVRKKWLFLCGTPHFVCVSHISGLPGDASLLFVIHRHSSSAISAAAQK
jgi:hypothetical protein